MDDKEGRQVVVQHQLKALSRLVSGFHPELDATTETIGCAFAVIDFTLAAIATAFRIQAPICIMGPSPVGAKFPTKMHTASWTGLVILTSSPWGEGAARAPLSSNQIV